MPRTPYKWKPSYPTYVVAYADLRERPNIAELARLLDVSRETIYVWRREYPKFGAALDYMHCKAGSFKYGEEMSRTDG